jgi:glycosyltransferase involved in cell wall biosynthesis
MDLQKEWPLVTVATLCFNTGKYVIEALECVVRQGYPNIQHIIIDDCSTDDSASLVAEWIEKHQYPCQYIRHSKNQGVHNTLKEIFALSKGKYWTTISDDLWTDTKLQDQVAIFENLDDSYAIVYGDTESMDKDGNIIEPSIYTMYRGHHFTPPSGNIFKDVLSFFFMIQAATIRLSHIQQMPGLNDNQVISEDWDWQLWLARHYKFYGLKDVYGKYRHINTSISRTLWNSENMHKVIISHVYLLLKYYRHPLNKSDENDIIFDKLLFKYFEICNLTNQQKESEIFFLTNVLPKFHIKHLAKFRYAWFKLTLKKRLPFIERVIKKS